jgi:hypothetical protein
MKMRLSAYDVSARLGAVVAAVGLLGAGPATPQDAFGLFQVAMSVEASARGHLPTFAEAHSYRITMAVRGAPTSVAIFDEDSRAYKLVSEERGQPTTYFVGDTVYSRSADGAWTKFDVRSASAAVTATGTRTPAPAAHRFDPRVRPLPDRILHGVRLGAFRMRAPARLADRHRPANETVAVTCFYEKVTSRLWSCSAPGAFTATFDRYDDPANRFTLPAAALHAPDAFRTRE